MDEIQRSLLMSKIQRIEPSVRPQESTREKASSVDFESLLEKESLQISKHAEKRLVHRNIELSESLKGKLTEALGSLEKKGARDSLVLSDDHAFIVNVPSRTLVTALQKDEMKDHIFTNIDSTLILR